MSNPEGNEIDYGARTNRDYWGTVWKHSNYRKRRVSRSISRVLEEYIQKSPETTMIEVGCAPGGWMIYFTESFGLKVDGIEYVPEAADVTRRNLSNNNISAEVFTADVFEFDTSKTYSIVFSGGFIEHFTNTIDAVKTCVALSDDLCITIIPNLYGINGFISKLFRPGTFAKHVAINREHLQQLHEEAGCTTLTCQYSEGLKLVYPFTNTDFSRNYPTIAKLLNMPVMLLNVMQETVGATFGIWLNNRICSRSIIYIGKRSSNS